MAAETLKGNEVLNKVIKYFHGNLTINQLPHHLLLDILHGQISARISTRSSVMRQVKLILCVAKGGWGRTVKKDHIIQYIH